MPIIEMFVTEGVLDDARKRQIHERVSRRVLEAEDGSWENELGREITWVLIHELAAGNWSVAGEAVNDNDAPRLLTRVTVPVGAINDRKGPAIAKAVQDEIVAALGEEVSQPLQSFLVLAQEDIGAGGVLVDYKQLVATLAIRPEAKIPDEVPVASA